MEDGGDAHARWSTRRILVTGGSGFLGSHLVDRLTRLGATVQNLDLERPWIREHGQWWRRGDVQNRSAVADAMDSLSPTHVVHLAADVDASAHRSLESYEANVRGTTHVLDLAASGAVDRIVSCSTQFVCQPGHLPRSDTDWSPHTNYGRSKVLGELATRRLDDSRWVIVRPTTIWGPGDDRYRRAFHRLMAWRLYHHPDVGPCLRSYGFVGNVAWQLAEILDRPASHVTGRVLYLGDPIGDVRDFVDAFHRAWHGRPAPTLPAGLARTLARGGDALGRIGLPVPIDMGRYRSLSTDYPVPIDRTFELLGHSPYDLEEGTRHTVAWLRGEASPCVGGEP